jgi:hypothetical protein
MASAARRVHLASQHQLKNKNGQQKCNLIRAAGNFHCANTHFAAAAA